MIQKFYSKVNPEELLHMIFSPELPHLKDEPDVVRTNISPEKEYLQSAHIYIPQHGHKFRPHIHLPQTRETHITQEAWIVITGLIKVYFYDTDGKLLNDSLLYPGWTSITFRGGHTYECLLNDTNVLEFKTGPYNGQEKDKEFIDES